jgi:hypothetical protein
MTTPRRTGKRSSAAKNEPFAHLMQIISRTPRQAARSAGEASAAKIVLELTAYRVRVVGRDRHGRSRPAASTNRLSAVTLVPLRSRAAHVVQLRSIAAVCQDGCNGSENGQKIHPRYPNAIPHGTCSERQFGPTNGTCEAIMWNEAGGIGRAEKPVTPRRSLRSPAGNWGWRARVECIACWPAAARRNKCAGCRAPSARRAGCRCRS